MKSSFGLFLKDRFENKIFSAIAITYICLCVGSAVFWAINFTVRNMLLSLLFCLFIPVIVGFEYALKIRCSGAFLTIILSLAFGAILGTCFNLYSVIPFFDLLLHGVAGFIFSCLGFALSKVIYKGGGTFFSHLVFAVCFSLTIAVLWEIFEYFCTLFLAPDMMEDGIVYSIKSYFLSGNHLSALRLDDITKTVIYYGDGKTFTIEGYLDLGLGDTMGDVLICTAFTLIFVIVSGVSNRLGKRFLRIIIPQTDFDGA